MPRAITNLVVVHRHGVVHVVTHCLYFGFEKYIFLSGRLYKGLFLLLKLYFLLEEVVRILLGLLPLLMMVCNMRQSRGRERQESSSFPHLLLSSNLLLNLVDLGVHLCGTVLG